MWGAEVVGVLGVADKDGGYGPPEQESLEVPARMMGMLFDSHQRSEHGAALQAELHQAQKMDAVGRLTGGIAHDFNNMLTVIMGFGQLGLDELAPDHPASGSIEAVLKAGTSATALTRQLLAFSRKQVLEPEVMNLNEVVQGIRALLKPVLRADIELVCQPSDSVFVNADRSQIEQVIMNLAVNARDAMPDGGRLTIEVEAAKAPSGTVGSSPNGVTGPHVRLTMRDTGTGMTEEVRAHIFEPFFTTKEVGEGTGLGLATVYGIVRQSQGWMSVESELGAGSTFTIDLPEVSPCADSAAAAPGRVTTPGGGPRRSFWRKTMRTCSLPWARYCGSTATS